MKMPKNAQIEKQCYKPSDPLVRYLQNKLQYDKKRKEIFMHGKRDLSEEEVKEGRNLDRIKVHVLDKYIFPSMANLTVFLEYIAKNEELRRVFEDDLKELFFGKPDEKPNANIVFQRFIQSAITWNWKNKENANDFRLALIYCLEHILFQYLTSIGLYLIDPTIANSVVSQDLSRVVMWTKLLARNVDIDVTDASREVFF
jgi:hypothetical protein